MAGFRGRTRKRRRRRRMKRRQARRDEDDENLQRSSNVDESGTAEGKTARNAPNRAEEEADETGARKTKRRKTAASA